MIMISIIEELFIKPWIKRTRNDDGFGAWISGGFTYNC